MICSVLVSHKDLCFTKDLQVTNPGHRYFLRSWTCRAVNQVQDILLGEMEGSKIRPSPHGMSKCVPTSIVDMENLPGCNIAYSLHSEYYQISV